jgi:large subunit ribosomal protein L23
MIQEKNILLAPVVSEKSVAAMEDNQYTFLVDTNSNKIEIRKAVEKQFSVHVLKVRTMNYEGKLKRMGRYQGRRASYKKAIVTLKEGESIPVFEGM